MCDAASEPQDQRAKDCSLSFGPGRDVRIRGFHNPETEVELAPLRGPGESRTSATLFCTKRMLEGTLTFDTSSQQKTARGPQSLLRLERSLHGFASNERSRSRTSGEWERGDPAPCGQSSSSRPAGQATPPPECASCAASGQHEAPLVTASQLRAVYESATNQTNQPADLVVVIIPRFRASACSEREREPTLRRCVIQRRPNWA